MTPGSSSVGETVVTMKGSSSMQSEKSRVPNVTQVTRCVLRGDDDYDGFVTGVTRVSEDRHCMSRLRSRAKSLTSSSPVVLMLVILSSDQKTRTLVASAQRW